MIFVVRKLKKDKTGIHAKNAILTSVLTAASNIITIMSEKLIYLSLLLNLFIKYIEIQLILLLNIFKYFLYGYTVKLLHLNTRKLAPKIFYIHE